MLEEVIGKPHVRRRLEASLLAGLIVDYVEYLTRRGHTLRVIKAYVAAVEHFGFWMGGAGRPAAAINSDTVTEFLTRHLPRCRCSAPRPRGLIGVRAALHQLLQVAPCPSRATVPVTPADVVVSRFDVHLQMTCGLAPATRSCDATVFHALRARPAAWAVRLRTGTARDTGP